MKSRFLAFAGRRAPVAILAALIACGALPAAAGNLTLDDLMSRLQNRPHRHDTFTERFTSPVLEWPVEASGELFYDAPDHLEKRTLKPRAETLLLDHGNLTFQRRQRTYHATLAEYPQVAPYVDSIRATLAGDRAALERMFHVKFASTGDAWSLVLTPAVASMTAELTSIRIDGALDIVHTVAIEHANGDRSVMTLTGAVSP